MGPWISVYMGGGGTFCFDYANHCKDHLNPFLGINSHGYMIQKDMFIDQNSKDMFTDQNSLRTLKAFDIFVNWLLCVNKDGNFKLMLVCCCRLFLWPRRDGIHQVSHSFWPLCTLSRLLSFWVNLGLSTMQGFNIQLPEPWGKHDHHFLTKKIQQNTIPMTQTP